jgi:hypothetical protein
MPRGSPTLDAAASAEYCCHWTRWRPTWLDSDFERGSDCSPWPSQRQYRMGATLVRGVAPTDNLLFAFARISSALILNAACDVGSFSSSSNMARANSSPSTLSPFPPASNPVSPSSRPPSSLDGPGAVDFSNPVRLPVTLEPLPSASRPPELPPFPPARCILSRISSSACQAPGTEGHGGLLRRVCAARTRLRRAPSLELPRILFEGAS